MTDIALQVDQTRAEGLIGASDSAAILGLDPYCSPMDKWIELRGMGKRDRPPFVQEAAEWGQALEPIVRGKYALMRAVQVSVPSKSTILDGWLRCTPDGFVTDSDAIEARGITVRLGDDAEMRLPVAGLLQVKTASAYKLDEWEHSCPPAYEVQCRVEMAVCDLPWCDIICLVGGQKLVGPIRIERNLELEANILRDLRAFWDIVQSGTEPPIDGSVAWSQYAAQAMRPTKVEIVADRELEQLIAERAMASLEEKAAKDRKVVANTSIMRRLAAAGANKVVTSGGGYATAYLAGAGTDWKGYAQSLGADPKNIPTQFRREGKTWTLRVSGEDES